jgi:hypothetical protein
MLRATHRASAIALAGLSLAGCDSADPPAAPPVLPATEAVAISGSLPRSGEECTARVTIVGAAGHRAVATFRFWRQAADGVWNWCANCDAALAQTCEGGVEFRSGEIGTLRFDTDGVLLEFRQSDGSGVLTAHFDADPWHAQWIHLDATGALGPTALVEGETAAVVLHAVP